MVLLVCLFFCVPAWRIASLVSTRFSLSMEMSRLTRDGTAEPISRDQILRRERGQGKLPDHEKDWQPYLVDPYSCYMCDHTYINTYSFFFFL